ncbi:MAG: lipase, partial [Fimbriimonadaceae bacterium]
MPNVNAERLKSYIHLIGGKRKLEELRESVPVAGASPLESFAIPGTQSGLAVTDGMELAQAARTGLDQMLIGNEPSSEQLAGLEAIIIPELRPAIDIVGGKFRADHQLWTHLSTDAAIRARIEKVIPSVGRIELPNNPQYPYGGTGFVVGKNLLMTNRHVAAIFANGLGSRSLAIKPRHKAGIDFVRERGGGEGTTLLVRRVVLIHPY